MCKPGGRILLLQHGKGSWGFINNVLDNGAGGGGQAGLPRWAWAVGGACCWAEGTTAPVRNALGMQRPDCMHPAAGAHYHKWGCWWNRDIEQIVRQAGLEIDSMSRWHFGTTYMVVARPALQ